ncbi:MULTISPECIES: LrgB family protein [unclassified Acinetobacter]|uniref:LrgB family protein n=1 Tax=unclassified Acinetobacter TaxID=196816 RepID=UPI002934384A|nr:MULTISPECIES: LrgB family protein [unclassified Acinetobacter]WOE33259.1 LrgB family protein [Acinetobacter sp. SAAs470]WOE36960.1 LrgB family protein [Acinetobacter sp. SAAs474]
MNSMAVLCLCMTLIGYVLVKKLYQKHSYLVLSPAILLPFFMIVFMTIFHISYETYMQHSHWIVWMLGPATVAFAIPIYEYRQIIKTHVLSISLGIIIGMLSGIISAFYLAKLFSFNQETAYSLMSRSISTPFAMELTSHIGGSVELVILFTMITGIAGVAIADLVLAVLKLDTQFAQGAALGNAAHGFGTVKAFMRHKEQGVAACLSMVLSGIFMVLLGPSMIHLVNAILIS